jgi:hypothetical protein
MLVEDSGTLTVDAGKDKVGLGLGFRSRVRVGVLV